MLCTALTCNLDKLQSAANAPGACQDLSTALQTQVHRGCEIIQAPPDTSTARSRCNNGASLFRTYLQPGQLVTDVGGCDLAIAPHCLFDRQAFAGAGSAGWGRERLTATSQQRWRHGWKGEGSPCTACKVLMSMSTYTPGTCSKIHMSHLCNGNRTTASPSQLQQELRSAPLDDMCSSSRMSGPIAATSPTQRRY